MEAHGSLDGDRGAPYFADLRLPSLLQHALDRVHGPADEPLRLLRVTAGVLLLFGTIVAVALALSGVAPRALQLAGVFWAIYGFVVGLTSGVLEPAIEGMVHVLSDWGLVRSGGGYSGIEALVVRGNFAAAAEEHGVRGSGVTHGTAGHFLEPILRPSGCTVKRRTARRSSKP